MNQTTILVAILAVSGLTSTAAVSAAPAPQETAEQRVYTYMLELDSQGRIKRLSLHGSAGDAVSRALEDDIQGWIFEPGGGVATSTTTYLRAVVTPRETAPDGFALVSVTTGPAPERLMQPAFPIRDQRAGNEGTVVMKLEIGPDGSVDRSEVHDLVGDISRSMAKAAADSTRQWRFTPEMVDGRAVASTILWPVCFLGPESSASQCAWEGPDAQRYSSKTVLTLDPASKLVSPLAFEGR